MALSSATLWKTHKLVLGDILLDSDSESEATDQCHYVQTRLATLLGVDHVNLLIGSGFTTGIGLEAKVKPISLSHGGFTAKFAAGVHAAAEESAKTTGRGSPNFEDDIRAALQLIGGLRTLTYDSILPGDPLVVEARKLLPVWEAELSTRLSGLAEEVLGAERQIKNDLLSNPTSSARKLLSGFLISFATRAAARERLHIFTTNYDRLIEYGCDLLGIQILDRFVGRLEPMFRASRLNVDIHYDPPGIRGEPRYLEGVVRLSKLHGSLDWQHVGGRILKASLPFGAGPSHPDLPGKEALMIYPNPAKDLETLEYPYAELFRDFSAAACQPNSVLFTFGYGFGDDHINRVIADMLTLPSTHVVIISFDTASGRIPRFFESHGAQTKISLLLGPHFGSLSGLVETCLPRPVIASRLSSGTGIKLSAGVP